MKKKLVNHKYANCYAIQEGDVTIFGMYLWEKYGGLQGDNYFYPLEWYVSTGRASTEFLKKLIDSKPFIIGRILAKGGSYEEAIANVKRKLKVA